MQEEKRIVECTELTGDSPVSLQIGEIAGILGDYYMGEKRAAFVSLMEENEDESVRSCLLLQGSGVYLLRAAAQGLANMIVAAAESREDVMNGVSEMAEALAAALKRVMKKKFGEAPEDE